MATRRMADLGELADLGTPLRLLWFKNIQIPPLQPRTAAPICKMSFGTMDINALVISGSDPGAVPGVSTNTPSFGVGRGRNRIDERLKGLALSRRDTTVIGSFKLVANDNNAQVALAA